MSDATSTQVKLTVPVTIVYPNIHAARAFGKKGKEQGPPKFSANFLFKPDSADLKQLKAVAARVAKEAFPGVAFSELTFPFKNGDALADKAKAERKNNEFFRGLISIKGSSQFRPQTAAIVKGVYVEYDETSNENEVKKQFFPGVECFARFTIKPFESRDKGVTAYLDMILATGKGTRLQGAGGNMAEEFKDYIGKVSAVDPTQGMEGSGQFDSDELDDEIPV